MADERHSRWRERQVLSLTQLGPRLVPLQRSAGATETIVGTSKAIQLVQRLSRQYAATQWTVLIDGETGTGKELVARAIHAASGRACQPFVALNCAAIPEALLENEIFGHTRGAFTGADGDRSGVFKAAEGSTLFLDEIGELPLGLQAKLLRVLESGMYRPLGSTTEVRADVRVIAATNRDLSRLVAQGMFRADLYYRLDVLRIHIPPLRQRVEDIPVLVTHLLERYAPDQHLHVAPEAIVQLIAAPWLGNVRELEHVVLRAVLGGCSGLIARFDLDAAVPQTVLDGTVSCEQLVALLVHHRGRLRPIAQQLGVSVRTVQRYMSRHGLAWRDFRKLGS